MTTNFTPGPYCDNGDGFIRQAEDNEGHRLFVASVVEIPFSFGGDRVTEANINLLKAAPEMYEALRLAYESMTGNNDPFKIEVWEAAVNAVFAALAKADGRSA